MPTTSFDPVYSANQGDTSKLPTIPSKVFFEPQNNDQIYKTFIITVTVKVGSQTDENYKIKRKIDPCPSANLIPSSAALGRITVRTGVYDPSSNNPLSINWTVETIVNDKDLPHTLTNGYGVIS